MAAPSTPSQPSRKGKKAWRKNVDITSIQQGLEELQTAQITHGGVLAEKDASELFVADTVGDADLATKSQHGRERKPLKAEQILGVRSAVPGLEGRKRKLEDAGTGVVAKKTKNGTYIPHKDLQRLRAVADGKSLSAALDEQDATHDPWAPSSPAIQSTSTEFDFITRALPKKKTEPKTLKHPPTSFAANGKTLPHVALPNPGKSYNPLVGDYTALLAREGAAAVEAEKQRLEALGGAEEKEVRAAAEAARVEEAENELFATDYEDSEWEGIQSEGEREVWTAKPKGRMTPMERKKVKARKEREAREVHERKLKERKREEERIKLIAREVAVRDRDARVHARTLTSTHEDHGDANAEEESTLRRPRLGKMDVPAAPLEITLPDELEDSLRRLRPEGDLMLERYRNLLVNGKMETRRRQGQRRQVKTTRSEKWSYKDWRLR